MRGVLVGLGLLLVSGFASLGCSSLLGLDEFSPSVGSAGAAGNSGTGGSGTGAGGAGGAAGGSGGMSGAGLGGTGGVTEDGCLRIYADAAAFDPFRGPSAAVYTIPLSTNLDGERADRLRVLAYAPKVGSYDLGDPVRQQRSTCRECVWIDTDVSEDNGATGGFFMVESGTLALDTVSDTANAPHKGVLSDVRFVESTIDPDVGTSSPIESGRCLRLAKSAWNFTEFNYAPTTISAIRNGVVPEWSRVTVSSATVSAVGQGSFWLQQGSGAKSGISVLYSPAGVDVGDLLSVRGVVRRHDASSPFYINAPDTWEGIASNAKGGGELNVAAVASIDDDTLEGALVRIGGPWEIVVIDSSSNSGSLTLQSGSGKRVRISTFLYDPTTDSAFADLGVGASLESVVGVVSFNSESGERELLPRSAPDLEGYQPAQ